MACQTTLLRKINVLSSENLLHPHVVTLFTQLDGLEELQRNEITTYYFFQNIHQHDMKSNE